MSDTSLIFQIFANDRASKTFDRIRDKALETKAVLALAFGPGLVPVLAAGTAAVAGLGGALSGVGASAAVFGAVFKTSFTEVQKASQKTDALREKIRLLGREAQLAPNANMQANYLKQQAKAAVELQARLSLLPPATRNVVVAYGGLKTAWSNFVDANKPATYAIMTGGFSALSRIIPQLQPLFDVAAGAVSRLVGGLTQAASGGGIRKVVGWLTAQAGPAITNLMGTAKNLGVVLARVFTGFAPTGQGILTWLNKTTTKWAQWSTSSGGFTKFAQYAVANGPKIVGLLGSIATSAVHIVQGISPLAPVSTAVAGALAKIIAAVPPSVITALAAAYVAWAAATKVQAIAQGLLNVVMDANPIGLVIAGVTLLVTVFVLLWKHSAAFRGFWIGLWHALRTAAVATWNALRTAAVATWNFLSRVGTWINAKLSGAWNAVRNAAVNSWRTVTSRVSQFFSWIMGIPGRISARLSTMWDGLKNGFRAALNWVIGKWNSLHFSLPGFSFAGISIPGVNIGVPSIPYLANGGNVQRGGTAVVGERGPELVSLGRGAQVTPLSRGGSAGVIRLDISGADSEMKRMIRKWIRTDNLLNA